LFLSEIYPSRIDRPKRKHDINFENHVDRKTYYCKECKKVWELCPDYISPKEEIMYYDIPSIGKTRKICLSCEI
tara:strand:- start:1024 stop:1245 length:222 start_codon:yes stop_codon:yes gene_type:complete